MPLQVMEQPRESEMDSWRGFELLESMRERLAWHVEMNIIRFINIIINKLL